MLISPHLDDAVLSCGQLLVEQPGSIVVTLFAGTPARGDEVRTPWDKACGFAHANDAMAARRLEDEAACARLDAVPHHLPFVESGYPAASTVGVEDAVRRLIDLLQPDALYAPLGIGHLDHVAAAGVCRQVFETFIGEKIVYEELPYRVLDPEGATEARVRWRVHDLVLLGGGSVDGKWRAVTAYRSQLWSFERGLITSPERYWRLS